MERRSWEKHARGGVDLKRLHGLQPSIRSLAEESTESRIRCIRTDRWITYAKAEASPIGVRGLSDFP